MGMRLWLAFLLLHQFCSAQWWISWESGNTNSTKGGGSLNPPPRSFPSFWLDSTPTLWLFGGVTTSGQANDFWKYNTTTFSWNQVSSNAEPSQRSEAVSWIDSSQNLWLFGGQSSNNILLSDMYKYTGNNWQIISSYGPNFIGSFGIKGIPSIFNLPGSRSQAASWHDSEGILWIFGGNTFTASNVSGPTCDMWSYNASSQLWTWVSGNNSIGVPGKYPLQYTGNTTNYQTNSTNSTNYQTNSTNYQTNSTNSTQHGQHGQHGINITEYIGYPGSRYGAAYSIDLNGNFWLFGGFGADVNGEIGYLNDLWMYNPVGGYWLWLGGNNTVGASSVYGHNVPQEYPGGRMGGAAWMDSFNDFWLLGGYGKTGYYDDLWVWNNNFVWRNQAGDTTPNSTSFYGIQHSTFYGAKPGGRVGAAAVVDVNRHNAWLFGGQGFDSTSFGYLNDLFKYSIFPEFPASNISENGSAHNWTWPVIIFVLGGIVCILIGAALGVAVFKSAMLRRQKKFGTPEPKRQNDVVQLDDLNVEEK